MKQISIRVSDEEYNVIKALAELNALDDPSVNSSVPAYVKRHILLLKRNDITFTPVQVENSSKKRFPIFLKNHEKELLKQAAERNGWSLSREIVFRLNSTLLNSLNEPCFFPEELLALRQSKNAIDTIGRNIQHIIRRERFITINDESFRQEVRDLISLVEDQKKVVNKLISSVVNRWNV
ncbi:TPA: hypothetical protein ACSTJY_004971 [Serratia fonticola]